LLKQAGVAAAAVSGSAAVLGSPGPARGASGATRPVRGGRITVAIVDQPVNMDPADAQLYSSIQVYDNIFSKLIEVMPDFRFVPSLASKWTQEDEKTWTFDLIDNAVFHNGAALTANDVKFTFDRLPKHPNSVFFSALKRTQVLGRHRVRFHLARPYGPFEAALAQLAPIVNAKAVGAANPKLKPVGTGPYVMKEWVQNDHVTLTRWPRYFKKNKPYLDEVIFRSIGDDTVRLTGLRTGELDWIQQVPAQQYKSLVASNDLKSSPGRPYFPYWVALNSSRPPFNDKRVRQAIAWAIDREEVVNLIWYGTHVPATEAVSRPSPWYTGIDPFKGSPDPDKAKALLKQAGRENLEITYLGQANLVHQIRTGEVLKSQLAKAGITVSIETHAPAQYFELFATHKYDMTSGYWSATLDPALFYFPFTSWPSPWNFPGINSPAINAALRKFVYSSDQRARKVAYEDVVRVVAEEAPVIFLSNQIQRYWTKPDVFGSVPLPSLDIRLEDMWVRR
jgi:peptide/nickel transport system substrate-binding protein